MPSSREPGGTHAHGREEGREGGRLLQQVKFAELVLTSRGVPCPSRPYHTPGLDPVCSVTELLGAHCGQPTLPSKPRTQDPQFLQPRDTTPLLGWHFPPHQNLFSHQPTATGGEFSTPPPTGLLAASSALANKGVEIIYSSI